MKYYLYILITLVVLTGCSSESFQPQESFHFASSDESIIKARRLLHDIAITHNLSFKDYTHKYPSGKLIMTVEAERNDGLLIILIGASDDKAINVSIHCHKKCSDWKNIYGITTSEFGNHWKISK